MSSHGGAAEPPCSAPLFAEGGDAVRAVGAASCCGARRAALGVGTGTAGRDAAAGFGPTGAAGLPTAADGARPRSDETFMPALRNTSSAALAPPARRGEVWAADGGS